MPKDTTGGFETKESCLEIKSIDEAGTIEGYGSVFDNVDQGGETVDRKAFSSTVQRAQKGGPMPRMLWQHDRSQVIGIWTEMREDDHGLYMKGRLLLELDRAKEAHVLLKNSAIDGLSIGYRVVKDTIEKSGVRRLLDVDLKETSVVTFPMNELATVTGVKQVHSIRDIERILRDAGVANNFAKLVATKGFDAAIAEVAGEQRDADSKEDEAYERLKASIKQLKENFSA